MPDSPSPTDLRSPRAARRWVHERLSDRAAQPQAAESPELVERVLARLEAAPAGASLPRARAPRAAAWRLAAAAGVLLVATLAGLALRDRLDRGGAAEPAPAPPPLASLFDVPRLLEGDRTELPLDAPERLLTREWDAVVVDARTLFTRMSTSLPR